MNNKIHTLLIFNNIKVINVLLIILLVMNISSQKLFSQENISDTLVFGSDSNFPPFEFLDNQGKPDGFNIDLIRAISREMGFNVKIKLDTWSKIKREFEIDGTIDISDMFYTKKRDSIADYAIPNMVTYDEIYVHIGTEGVYALKDLTKKKVAILASSTIQEYLQTNYPEIKLVLAKSEPEALRMLSQKKVDAALVSKIIAKDAIKQYSKFVVNVGNVVIPREYGFVVQEGNHSLLYVINSGLVRLKESGEFNRIYKKWFPTKVNSWIYKNLKIIGISLVLLILAIIFFLYLMRMFVKKKTRELEFYNSRLKLISNVRMARIDKHTAYEQTVKMMRKVKQAFNIEACLVRVFKKNQLVLFGEYGFGSGTLVKSIPKEQKLITKILESKSPIYKLIKNINSDYVVPKQNNTTTQTFDKIILVPLQADDRIIGVLEVYLIGDRKKINDIDLEHLQIIGNQIAISIENTQLFEQNEKQKEILVKQIIVRKKAELKIKKFNRELEQRVLDRTAELKDANRELEEFAYSISHDLKAPLRSIIGFSEIIKERYKTSLNEEALQYFQFILDAGNNMANLIDDLLRFAHISKNNIVKIDIDLRKIMEKVLSDIQIDVKKNNAKIIIPDHMPTIKGDKTLLTQLFANLLINGITYSRKNISPIVIVTSEEIDGKIFVKIKDNGIGILPEYHDKIFNIFQRLHSQDEYPGTGIGLAIAKKAVHSLGGQINIESEVGKGTTFIVIFDNVF